MFEEDIDGLRAELDAAKRRIEALELDVAKKNGVLEQYADGGNWSFWWNTEGKDWEVWRGKGVAPLLARNALGIDTLPRLNK
jgi:hypothetical protein